MWQAYVPMAIDALGKAGAAAAGATRTNTTLNSSVSTALNATVNPNIFVSMGPGSVAPSTSGGGSASAPSTASAPSSAGSPWDSFFGSAPSTAAAGVTQASGAGGGGLGALLSDPLILMGIVGIGAFLLFSGKGA